MINQSINSSGNQSQSVNVSFPCSYGESFNQSCKNSYPLTRKNSMLRSFLPIGQGCFAVEQFLNDRYNIVFDCGTATKSRYLNSKTIIERQIQQTFKPKTRIQKVFISHLHDDHVNGLPYLLRNYHVSRVYLPYMTQSEQVIALILLLETIDIEDAGFFQNLIIGRVLEGDSVDTRIVYVLPRQSENINIENDSAEVIPSGYPIEIDTIDQDSITNHWKFIPFVFDSNNRTILFENELCRLGIDKTIQDQILNDKFWENRDLIKKKKKAYKQIVQDINLSNMVVWSGTSDDHIRQYSCKEDNCFHTIQNCRRCCRESGCMYTGDYHASNTNEWDELRRAFDSVWDSTGVFTIPHHGSSNNYNPEFTEQKASLIINAGYQNRYGHPHQTVLRHLIDSGSNFYWVNEHIGSEVVFRVR